MKRKLINFVTASLHFSGLQLVRQTTTYRQQWVLLVISSNFVFAFISTIIESLLNDDTSIYKFINPVPYVSLGITIMCGIATMIHHRTAISQMLHEMDDHVYVYPDEDLFDMQYDWYLDEGNLVIVMVAIFCAQMSFLCCLCVPAVYELCNYGQIKTFVYPGWLPWARGNVLAQIGTIVLQFSATSSGLWLNQMMIMPVLLVLCEYLRQYKRLKRAVIMLQYRSDLDNKSFDKKLKENIIHCVVHVQKLRRNFYLFEIWFSKIFSWELAVCASSMAIAVYLMTSAASLSKMYNLIIVVVFVNVNLLARCLMGEFFFDLNDEIAYTIFTEIEWYNLSKEHQKLLLMFHHMACQPLKLFGFRIFAITRVMFSKIIRTTYSVFNVIKVSLN